MIQIVVQTRATSGRATSCPTGERSRWAKPSRRSHTSYN
nr:MAG TPA: hypothetical protein [Bacteriophage sp.]